MEILWLVLAIALTAVVATVWGWILSVRRLQAKLTAILSRKQSQSTRYGQITEQFAPFLPDWPWDPKRFVFIGSPVDGIQFTDEGLVIVEIKTANSKLTAVQRQVRDHVQAGRVAWHEVRIG